MFETFTSIISTSVLTVCLVTCAACTEGTSETYGSIDEDGGTLAPDDAQDKAKVIIKVTAKPSDAKFWRPPCTAWTREGPYPKYGDQALCSPNKNTTVDRLVPTSSGYQFVPTPCRQLFCMLKKGLANEQQKQHYNFSCCN